MQDNDELRDIRHNLKVAEPSFLTFIKGMDKSLSKWIQYNGVREENSKLFFMFKSSNSSIMFEVYAGVNVNDIFYLLRSNSNAIYDYFRELKYSNI